MEKNWWFSLKGATMIREFWFPQSVPFIEIFTCINYVLVSLKRNRLLYFIFPSDIIFGRRYTGNDIIKGSPKYSTYLYYILIKTTSWINVLISCQCNGEKIVTLHLFSLTWRHQEQTLKIHTSHRCR